MLFLVGFVRGGFCCSGGEKWCLWFIVGYFWMFKSCKKRVWILSMKEEDV